jgi:hypothetical protein
VSIVLSKLDVIDGELLYEGGYTEGPYHLKHVTVTDEGSGRWESYHLLVVKDAADNLWGAEFSRGLTENQDVQPFEDDDEVEFKPVEAKTVTTVTYEFVKESA